MNLSPFTGEPEHGELGASIGRVLADICTRQALHGFWDGDGDIATRVWEAASDLGWLAAPLPEACGGLGLGTTAAGVLHFELGRVLAPGPFIATLAGAQWLADFATPATTDAWLPLVAAGKATIATPSAFGAEAAASLHDGRVDGAATVLGSATADLLILPVRDPSGQSAIALIRPETGGAELTAADIWDRTRALCRAVCKGAQPLEIIADPDGRAARSLMRHLCLAVASDSLGAGASIADTTIDYLKTRIQFERPIGSFQAIKHRAADIVARLHTARQLVAQGFAAGDDGDMWAALAKADASEACVFVAGDSVQLHGGIGHTWEYDCHMFLKRARLNEALIASNAWLRDLACDDLNAAAAAGRSTMELAL